MDNKIVKIAYIGGPDLLLRLSLIKLLICENYKVFVIGSSRKEKERFERERIPYCYYYLNRKFNVFSDIKSFFQLYKILKKEKPYCIHAFDTKPTILGRIAAKMAGVPVIIGTIPGMGSLFSENTFTNKIFRIFYIIAQKIACGLSDLTIFQNSDDFNFFVLRHIISPSKATIIKGSGVDIEKFSPENLQTKKLQKTKAELGLNSKKKVFMISRLVKYKGIKDFLEAAKILKSKYQEVDFFLVGPKDNTVAAFPLEKVKKYANVVKYTGHRNDIPEVLYFADIVVLPTYYREGIPRILLEAASMRKPIVTTNIPGCREIVNDGINGFLVPPKDSVALAKAIEKFILNDNLRKQMGKISRERVIKEFSLEIVFKQTLNLYKKLFQNKEEVT